jgi:hypothetical protein
MTHATVFAAPWDQKLTALTVLLSVITLGVAGVLVWIGLTRMPTTWGRIFLLANAVIPVGLFVVAALMGPRGYSIEADRLVVERRVFPVVIPLASIREVEPLRAERVGASLRTLGNGGFFGYYGRFRNRALGDYRMYATRGDGLVLIRAERPYVLTPGSPEEFIETLNRARRAAAGDLQGG